MTKAVKWNFNVYVEEGPTLTSSDKIDAEAVDIISIPLEKGANVSATVDIQPGDLDEVKFVYIKLKSGTYGKVKYKFNDGSADSAEIVLDKDHIVTSNELVKLFLISPNKIIFTNTDVDVAADIEVVVARKAV